MVSDRSASDRTTRLRPATGAVAPGHAAPVVATDHAQLLYSDDPILAANKRLCYDMYRIVLQAGRADRVPDFIGPDYIQHNPNVVSGAAALQDFIRGSRPERPVVDTIELPLVSIVAERDLVTFTFVRPERDEAGEAYHTSWFDQFRVEGAMIVEHWDPALKSGAMLRLDPNSKSLSR